jgi:threonine/homoserine/homoserine lactone efflux protein
MSWPGANPGDDMTLSSLLLFVAVYFVAVATPGPGVAALVARVLAHGLRGVAPFIAGYFVGDMIWLTFAAAGLAVIAKTFAGVFVAIKFLGAAYLLYLAWRMATAPAIAGAAAPATEAACSWRAFVSSLSLTLGNPKVMVFFLSIMPLVVDLRTLTALALFELGLVCGIVIFATLALYALAANRARGLLRSTRAMRFLNRGAASLMAGAAVAVATR